MYVGVGVAVGCFFNLEVFHHINHLHTTDLLRIIPCIPFVSGPLQLRQFIDHNLDFRRCLVYPLSPTTWIMPLVVSILHNLR